MSNIYGTLTFTEAEEIVHNLLTEKDADILGDLVEYAAEDKDRALAVIMYLVFKARGIDVKEAPAEIANALPTVHDLVLPPGFKP